MENALTAIRLAREIFPRMSFDLIYAARRNQTVEAWEAELKQAVSYAVDHLSLYQLTIEEGTPFYGLHKAGKLIVPDGDQSALLYEATQSITAAIGMPAYEVSNHAAPGAESRHKPDLLALWRLCGHWPGAHGRLTVGRDKLATATERQPEAWLDHVERHGHGMVDRELLDREEQADELLLMGLRLKEGIDLTRWQSLSAACPTRTARRP